MISRKDKEKHLKQHSIVVWFTGLSGAGKTSIALLLEKRLFDLGYLTQVLDGDIIRSGINNKLGFSQADRKENIRRIAEVSKLFIHSGIITLNCFISPTNEIRRMAKDIIGKKDFLEVFVNAPLEVCEKRDVKGLYKKARRGELKNFSGIDSLYEKPHQPDLELMTDTSSIEESVEQCLKLVLSRVERKS